MSGPDESADGGIFKLGGLKQESADRADQNRSKGSIPFFLVSSAPGLDKSVRKHGKG